MNFLITGGAGFIGSAVVRYLLNETDHHVLNLDKLTYAGNLASLVTVARHPRYQFVQGDISDAALVAKLLQDYRPDTIMHLAAESHVDRSIDGPSTFIQTNIVGTYTLLEAARAYWYQLPDFHVGADLPVNVATKQSFRFHHISTDEVYGSLGRDGLFTEETAYDPSSPYSASKASSDHLVRAWHRTYDLPTVVSNCSNNYGPYQFPEKLIPLMILNALEGKPLPVYGQGQQIRDWLYVEDHAEALYRVATSGRIGEIYNIGGHNEKTNLEVVQALCDILDAHKSFAAKMLKGGAAIQRSCRNLITFVPDRPGHDQRYAIDATKIRRELSWQPRETIESGLAKTVGWYLDNVDWWQPLRETYDRQRLGLTT